MPSNLLSDDKAEALLPKPMRREIELDFIRGIAILLVVDFHSPKPLLLAPFVWLGWLHFGWAGVDIFFVLSGFLVGGLLVKETKLRGRVDAKRFLIRRGFKIWPQYYVFLLLLLVSGHRTLGELWGNLLNIQNYVGGVAHTWTLAVEEHAYLLLVAALAVAAWLHVRMRVMFFWTAGVVVLVNVWDFVLAAHKVNSFTRTDTRIGGILCGLLLAMLYHYAPEKFKALQNLRWVWVAMLVAVIAFLRAPINAWWMPPLTYLLADLAGVATLLLLYRRRADTAGQRNPVYRLVAWVGLYSYGIYLWHISVLAPVASLARHVPVLNRPVLVALGCLVSAILLGVVATKLVEFPALALRDRLFPRRVDAATGIPAETERKMHVETAKESVSVAAE